MHPDGGTVALGRSPMTNEGDLGAIDTRIGHGLKEGLPFGVERVREIIRHHFERSGYGGGLSVGPARELPEVKDVETLLAPTHSAEDQVPRVDAQVAEACEGFVGAGDLRRGIADDSANEFPLLVRD